MSRKSITHPKQIRLNKYLSLCGVGSRRNCESLILNGRIALNGSIVKELATTVSKSDLVRFDGRMLQPEKLVYILLNKPTGLLTTLYDPQGRPHVGDLLRNVPFVKPVGRLDRNTTGVLLFTNDGDLLYCLTHPKYKIVRTYTVEVNGNVSTHIRKVVERGVPIGEDDVAHGTVLEILKQRSKTAIVLSMTEGKYREIRRMFKVLGHKVISLDRISFAGIGYGGLQRGKWRFLDSDEVSKLKSVCDLKD